MAGAAVTAMAAGTAVQAQEVRVSNAGSMAGVSQVVIGSFVVAFLTARTDRARAGGGLLGSGFGGNSRAISTLQGVGDAEFQAATEAAYADFLEKLSAAGMTVMDRSAWLADMSRQRARPSENGREQGLIMARDSRAQAKIFSPVALGGPMISRENSGYLMNRGMSENATAVVMSMGSQTFARANNQTVISAFYVVDFANAETYGGWFRNSSAVQVQAGLALTPEISNVVAFTPDRRIVTASLREPIAVGGDYGTFADATSGGHRAAEMAANVIGILGGIGSNNTRRYIMDADPARWTAGVGELAAASNERMIQALRTGR